MRLSAALFAAALSAGLTVAAQAQNPEMAQNRLSARLTGSAEAPTTGATSATGTFNLTLKPDQGQICYNLRVTGVEAPTAAHIHKGESGKAGPPVVTLKAPKNGNVEDCASASKELIQDIQDNPDNYYVNVHNKKFPQGAVRGQLSEGALGPMTGGDNGMMNDTSATHDTTKSTWKRDSSTSTYGRDTTMNSTMGRDTTTKFGSDTITTKKMGTDSTNAPPR